MEIKEFIQNFADQLDDTDAAVITPETEFRELETSETLKNAKTIQELFDQINK